MKKNILKNKLLAFSLAFAVSLVPVFGAADEASAAMAYIPAAGKANLKVIDISHYDVPSYRNKGRTVYLYNKIKWPLLKKCVNAIYIKATEGTGNTDPCYKTLARSAQSAGISRGFYHYFWPKDQADAKRQADIFYNAIKKYKYDCAPALDVEEKNYHSGAAITNDITAFANEFKSKSGQDIMIYSSQGFINENFGGSLSKYRLWIAHWNVSSPKDTTVWHNWDMWQYSGRPLAVGGMPCPVDCDKATGRIFLNSVSGMTQLDYPDGTQTFPDLADDQSGVTVSGWAISYYGVSRVDVCVDGESVGTVSKEDFTARSDVGKKFGGAGYADAANSGYSFTIPDGSLPNGRHVVRTAAVDSRGNAVWSSQRAFTVNIPDDKTGLDGPSGTFTGDITASGWAVSYFGIDRVEVYVDGAYNGMVSNDEMTERADIEKEYAGGGYKDLAHSGFSYSIPNIDLAGGSHVVRTVAIDENGDEVWSAEKTFTLNVPANQISLDKPSGAYKGVVGVSGWAISHYGVNRVNIYVDGRGTAVIKNAAMTENTGAERTFANKGFNDFAHSGFSYTIPSGKLTPGTHTVSVAMVDNSGKTLYAAKKNVYGKLM